MTVEVVVPQIGEAVAELTLTHWVKQVGDRIAKGDVLFEVDSDKAIVEVEAFVDGTLIEILSPDGSSVMPQQVVAIVATEGEAAAPASAPEMQMSVSASGAPPAVAVPESTKASPVAQRLAADLGVSLDAVAGSGPGGRIVAEDVRAYAGRQVMVPVPHVAGRSLASPRARRRARELGVDISPIRGTGVDGLVIVRDVETARAATQPMAVPVSPASAGETMPLGKLRHRIAERTTASKQQVPHFYLIVDADMTAANALRDYCRDGLGWDKAPTYTDILIRATALAVKAMPEVNRSYAPDGLVVRQAVNVGVAVSTDAGLVAPVIADADTLNLRDVSVGLREVAKRARDGRLRPADLQEKSITISNLGMYAVDAFVAIIDMPDPMILAVGRVAERIVPVNGQAVIKPMCTLTLSVDHRVMDGVLGAQFLEAVKSRLEHPYEILGSLG